MSKNSNVTLLATYKPAAHQQEVDEMQARIRADVEAGRRSLFKPAAAAPEPSKAALDHRIAEELAFVIRNLEHLGAVLAGDSHLLRRHATELQSIDLMKQILGHLGRVVAAGDKDVAVDNITLGELKARLKRKPLRSITD